MKSFRTHLCGILLALTSLAVLADKININEADLATLGELNGVGQSRAEAIIAHRKAHGPFKSVDDLAKVKGIGLSIVEKNREQLTVGDTDKSRRQATVD